MNPIVKAISGGGTAVLVAVGLTIGGGVPLSPARIAEATGDAARNSSIAARNTKRAATDTEALATIAENVQSQVDTSKALLATQLKLQDSSRLGAERSKKIATGVVNIHRALNALRNKVERLTRSSSDAAVYATHSSTASSRLAATLRALRARFDQVVEQSRRLNRKARGYQKLRDGPG